MDTSFEICRTCDRALPLTKEFWHRNSANKSGWNLHCKKCDREYYQARKHGEPSHRGKKEPEVLHYDKEPFGEFETEALKTKRETAAEGIISIYQEI